MFNHDRFRELSAIAAIGQLSAAEDGELNDHLRQCESCRELYSDYAAVIQRQLPQADATRWHLKSAVPTTGPESQIRDRFLARARAEGMAFSLDAERKHTSPGSISNWKLYWVPSIAVATMVAVSVAWFGQRYQLLPRSRATPTVKSSAVGLDRENDALRAELTRLRGTIENEEMELERADREVSDSEGFRKGLEIQLAQARQQAERLSAALQQANSQNGDLVAASNQKGAVITDLQSQNDKLYTDMADMLSSKTILQAEVRDLNESLRRQSANEERERQLTSVSEDVRQLMGARSLHVIDVRDVFGEGQFGKAFGRVFYAEKQSLIFYAFDLSSGELNSAKYTFQAWGERKHEPQPRNLGTFEVDDREQRRWVLKVKDSDLLAGIDSVFVTAESLSDTKEPSGKKLLYTYLNDKPNHP